MEKAPFEFGITYVLNPNDGEKEIRAHLQNIREMGFTMIRTFLPWDGVEPADGIFEFGMIDSIHDIAAELGLHILESLRYRCLRRGFFLSLSYGKPPFF